MKYFILECDENEEYALTPVCEKTCSEFMLEDEYCPRDKMFENCTCKNGFHRNVTGQCVPWEECKQCLINGVVC